MNTSQEAKIVDLAIRLLFLGLFIYSALVMVAPLAGVVIWAVILCIALYPAFDWLSTQRQIERLRDRYVPLGRMVWLRPGDSARFARDGVSADLQPVAQPLLDAVP